MPKDNKDGKPGELVRPIREPGGGGSVKQNIAGGSRAQTVETVRMRPTGTRARVGLPGRRGAHEA